MNREEAKDKLRKLIAHEKSARKIGNADEAKAYARHIRMLCKRHNLTRRSLAEPKTKRLAQRAARPASAPKATTRNFHCSCGMCFTITTNVDAVGMVFLGLSVGVHEVLGHTIHEST